MRYFAPVTIVTLTLVACGGGQQAKSPAVGAQTEAPPGAESEVGATPSAAPEAEATAMADPEGSPDSGSGEENEFVLRKSDTAKDARGATPSKIKPTKTEAAIKFIVIDKDKGPIDGVVISLTAVDGKKYYTEETDAEGYAEVLVPVGQKYDLVYLSLGRQDIAASVPVSDEPNQNIKLTVRYKRHDPPTPAPGKPGFVLEGVNFDTNKATLRADSLPRFESIIEYLTHKKRARIEISGHTDNVGNPKGNKALSDKRAQACRDYLISKGIDASRIEAVGYGDERPIASNDTKEGRQKNRRIEATEL